MTVENLRQQHTIEATITPRPDAQGREWDVTIIGASDSAALVTVHGREYVKSKNGRLYSTDGIKASVPMWEGVRVFDNHLTDAEFEERAGMRSVAKEWLGSIVAPRWDEGTRSLKGLFKVVEEATAKKLLNAHNQGILDTIGLSIDTVPIGPGDMLVEGERLQVIEGFDKIFSVDLVAEPAAGGKFNRLIAATQTQGVVNMSEETQTQEQEAPPVEQAAPAAIPPELVDLIRQLIAEALAAAQAPAEMPVEESQDVEEAQEAEAPETNVEERISQLESLLQLNRLLAQANLPADAAQLVREAYAGRIVGPEEVERMIENVRTAFAARDPSGRVRGNGGGTVQAGLNADDWKQLELMRLVGGNMAFRRLEAQAQEHEVVAERLTESYRTWIKSGRPRGNTRRLSEWLYEAFGDPMDRAYEAATTSSLSSIVKNTVNIFMASDFAMRHQWWAPIVREEEFDTIDQATLVRFYGIGNLDVVDEGQAYTEKALVDEEETSDFVKRGNYIAITLETFLRDKVNKVRRLPEVLADSWYNTLSNQVATVFTTNTAAGPALADTGALFNATAVASATGHANLLTAALSFTAYGAARTAMRKQTHGYQGAGARALIMPKYLLVPVDLEVTAKQIIGSEQQTGTANNDVNPYQGEVEIIVVPEWTDTNNWALVADPQQYPAIWSLFYRGKRVPELFTSDSETQGAMFTNDTLRYKVRQMTFYFSSTYTCSPVSDYRPLHKSNVTGG